MPRCVRAHTYARFKHAQIGHAARHARNICTDTYTETVTDSESDTDIDADTDIDIDIDADTDTDTPLVGILVGVARENTE